MSYSTDKPNFLEFYVKMAKMTLKVKVNDLHFQYQPRVSQNTYMFGANLVILAQICDELLHRQAKFPRILSQNGQNDLEGQGQWPPFSIPAESIPGRMFWAHLVIPAQTCDELSCGQSKVYGRLREKHRCIVMRIDEDSSAYTQNHSREWSVPTGSTAGSGRLISSQYHRPIDCGFCLVTTPNTRGKTLEQSIVTWMFAWNI